MFPVEPAEVCTASAVSRVTPFPRFEFVVALSYSSVIPGGGVKTVWYASVKNATTMSFGTVAVTVGAVIDVTPLPWAAPEPLDASTGLPVVSTPRYAMMPPVAMLVANDHV